MHMQPQDEIREYEKRPMSPKFKVSVVKVQYQKENN